MKLTKKHLKALIQEELDNMGEGFRTDRKDATKNITTDLGMDKDTPSKLATLGDQATGAGAAALRKGKTKSAIESIKAAIADLTPGDQKRVTTLAQMLHRVGAQPADFKKLRHLGGSETTVAGN